MLQIRIYRKKTQRRYRRKLRSTRTKKSVKQRGGEYTPGNFEIQFNELFRNGVDEDKLAELENIVNSNWNTKDNMNNTPLLALVKVLYYCYYPEESYYNNTDAIDDCNIIYDVIKIILGRLAQKNTSGPINKKHYTALDGVLDAPTYLKEQDLRGYTIHKILWDIFQKGGNILFQEELLAIANNGLLDADENLHDPYKFNSTVNAFSIAQRKIEEEQNAEYAKKYNKNLVIFSDIFRLIDGLQDEIAKTKTPMGKKGLEKSLILQLKKLFIFISKQDESYDFVKDYKKVCSDKPCNFMCNNISPQVKEKLRKLPSPLYCKNKIISK